MARHPHYRHTTLDQRRVMFEEWERLDREHGSVTRACEKAHVSRDVFYDWKERYLERGVEEIRYPESRAPKHPHELASKLRDEAAVVKKEHPTWGLRKVAAVVAQRRGIPMPWWTLAPGENAMGQRLPMSTLSSSSSASWSTTTSMTSPTCWVCSPRSRVWAGRHWYLVLPMVTLLNQQGCHAVAREGSGKDGAITHGDRRRALGNGVLHDLLEYVIRFMLGDAGGPTAERPAPEAGA